MRKTIKLKKVLGTAFGISITIGSTIGAGILRAPGSIAALLPNSALILSCWLLTGLYILLCASSYAELTTMLPKVGGAFNYAKRAFGNYIGFTVGWFDFILNATAPAFFCIVLGQYSVFFFPQLKDHAAETALGYLTFFTLINLPGIKSSSIVQQVTSALKMILLLVLVGGCFFSKPVEADVHLPPALFNGALIIAFFKAMQLILGSYDGWMAVSVFAEEDNDPGKNVPRSYFIGAITVIVLYLLINAAILYVLPVNIASHSTLAAADAAAIAFGNRGATFINIIAVFSIVSILNAYVIIPPRILFGISREGYFTKYGTTLNIGGTPYYSVLVCYVLAVYLIFNNSFEQIFGLSAVMLTIVTAFSFASLLWLRKKEPDLPRPYKARGYPYVTILALTVTLVLFVGFVISDSRSFWIVAGIFVVSYPCYRLIAWLNRVRGN